MRRLARVRVHRAVDCGRPPLADGVASHGLPRILTGVRNMVYCLLCQPPAPPLGCDIPLVPPLPAAWHGKKGRWDQETSLGAYGNTATWNSNNSTNQSLFIAPFRRHLHVHDRRSPARLGWATRRRVFHRRRAAGGALWLGGGLAQD